MDQPRGPRRRESSVKESFSKDNFPIDCKFGTCRQPLLLVAHRGQPPLIEMRIHSDFACGAVSSGWEANAFPALLILMTRDHPITICGKELHTNAGMGIAVREGSQTAPSISQIRIGPFR